MVFPYSREGCTLSLKVSWVVLHLVPCHATPASSCCPTMCGCAALHSALLTPAGVWAKMASVLGSQTGKNIHKRKLSCTVTQTCSFRWTASEEERFLPRETCRPTLRQRDLLAGAIQVPLELLGFGFPFWFVAQSFILLLAVPMLPAASGPEKPFVLLAGETNTNACIREVTLDFHTDRFSFFFFV